jgi:DNA repair exonuclease SbcCD ATPase subunit
MLPFADHRAYHASLALAETGMVHKIGGGETVFREYLELLSYGSYYSTIIMTTQEFVNEISRELAAPNFERFETLPLLLTELTNLHMRKEHVRDQSNSLKTSYEVAVQSLAVNLEQKSTALSKKEVQLAELKGNLQREKDKEEQLLGFLKLTDDSAKVVAQIKKGLSESRSWQKTAVKKMDLEESTSRTLNQDIELLKSQLKNKRHEEVKCLEDLKKQIESINKAIILKEEAIQQSERFPKNHHKYSERLIVEVRREMTKKIDWLNKVTEYFQEKYVRRMTSSRTMFNKNVVVALKKLDLKRFDNVFLDQDFVLHVVRENGARQPVETLSASEKLTLSLLLMLAAKQTFLSDFPLFIIDELTLSYDPARFKQITNYLSQRVPYIVVTSLTTGESRIPEVVYET